jgi:hypothetical protein
MAANCVGVAEVGRLNQWDRTFDVFIRGDYAYVATCLSGLQILDISNPENLQLIGHYDDNPSQTHSVDIQEDYAYLADYSGGLRIVDISDPENPFETGFLVSRGLAEDVFVSGNYAYLVEACTPEGGGGLRIIDVSNPESPEQIGYLPTYFDCNRIEVKDNYAYIARHSHDVGLLIADISDPENPDSVTSYLEIEVENVFLSDNIAYVAATNTDENQSFLIILDISIPNSISELARCPIESFSWDIMVSGEYAYMACSGPEMMIYNISDPDSIYVVSSYSSREGCGRRILITENHAILALDRGGFAIIDVSDPYNLVEVANYNHYSKIVDVDVTGTYAFLAEHSQLNSFYYDNGLRVIDVENPELPNEIQIDYPVGPHVKGVHIHDHMIYMLNNDLNLVDIYDPTNPIERSLYHRRYYPEDIFAKDNTAFCAWYTYGLIALDVANPERPQEINVFEFYHPKDVCVSGNFAFVTDCNLGEHMGLFTIDISNIRELSEVSFFETETCPTDVAVHNQYVYLLVDVLGLYVLDVTNPEDPRQIGLCNTPGAAEGLWLSYDYAYIETVEKAYVHPSCILS